MDIQSIVNQKDAHIIDVRELSEFNNGHIETALHMPLSTFRDYIDQIKEMNGPKVFYCRSGNRSGQAVKFLSGLGVTDIYNGGSLTLMSSYMAPYYSN
jgi:rhodanese-related sulfurtransferase